MELDEAIEPNPPARVLDTFAELTVGWQSVPAIRPHGLAYARLSYVEDAKIKQVASLNAQKHSCKTRVIICRQPQVREIVPNFFQLGKQARGEINRGYQRASRTVEPCGVLI